MGPLELKRILAIFILVFIGIPIAIYSMFVLVIVLWPFFLAFIIFALLMWAMYELFVKD